MNNDKFSQANDPKPFHSSGYARISNGDLIGSTNGQSFGQRSHIERNRTSVSRYGDSLVGLAYIHRNATKDNGVSQAPSTFGRRRMGQSPAARPGMRVPNRPAFREPPPRYNPYG